MLGGAHFKKKIDKKAKKAAAKQNKKSAQPSNASKQGSSASSASSSSKGASGKSRNQSTLKGPIVAREHGSSRDAANDRKNIPFANHMEEKRYKRDNRIPYQNTVVDTSRGNMAKQALASSAAQRRRVIRRKGDEDLLSHFREKLNASTFRLLNEQIYSSPNAFAGQLLRDQQTFEDYHTGYRQQLVQWPVNPNTLIVDALLGDRRGKFTGNKEKSMPGHIPTSWVVADMGCGDAQIAAKLKPQGYAVHSFDFCATNEHVVVADSTKVPLGDNSVDVCIFSLSLMATDYEKSLFEAFRILKPNRLLKIIEVRSRIPHPRRFAEMVEGIGFSSDYSDVVGDYFVAFDFIKKDGQKEANRELRHAAGDVLVPSLYKKR